MTQLMRVTELWRFPVKSLQGERLDSVFVGPDGLEGDRRFAIYDTATGFSRERPAIVPR